MVRSEDGKFYKATVTGTGWGEKEYRILLGLPFKESTGKRYYVSIDSDFFDRFVDEIDIADYKVSKKDNSLHVTDGQTTAVVPAKLIENVYGAKKGTVVWKIGKDAGPKGDRVVFEKDDGQIS